MLVAQYVQIFATPWTVCSPPGSTALGILQARILEWVAIPSPGDLPNPGIEAGSSEWQADVLPSELPGTMSNYTKIFSPFEGYSEQGAALERKAISLTAKGALE